MLRNLIYITSSILLFFLGIVIYGIILNLREIPLNKVLKTKGISTISNTSLIIDRRNYTLELYSDTTKIKTYNVVFGRNASNTKLSKDDFVTPRGQYKICSIDTNNHYYKKMFLDYPNKNDAAEAFRSKLINQDEFTAILNSLKQNGCSYDGTKIGGNIGIQGTGEYNIIFKNLPFVFNWTNGSIALSNENIDELLSVVKIGTKVTIKN